VIAMAIPRPAPGTGGSTRTPTFRFDAGRE
jgi:hypothetical protein